MSLLSRFALSLCTSKVFWILFFCTLPKSAVAAHDPFRLDRIGVVKFVPTAHNELDFHEGVLHVNGLVTWRPARKVARPSNVQEWTLNRLLVRQDDWTAYYRLGFGALFNFDIFEDGAINVYFGEERYYTVRVSSDALLYQGTLANLSTRLFLSSPGETATAGIIVSERQRRVLIRAVGPGLQQFGVTDALEDPRLTLYRGADVVVGNDQWSLDPGNARLVIQGGAVVGAFALFPGASDAALMVVLEPGAYTVEVGAAGGSRGEGTVLIEVYALPSDFLPASTGNAEI